ncbi:MAG: hypothetical protein ACJAZ9_000593 [Neolewinella sp.]|jgi:hypothetical protein
MILSDVKQFLSARETFTIVLPDGSAVPSHFHVTEVGEVTKNFIDCGGTLRRERKANFQLWSSDDYDHRLEPGKLVKIIEMAERQLGLADLEIEVEFQGKDTIQKFSLVAEGDSLRLTGMATDCLAKDNCGIAEPKKMISLAGFTAAGDAGCTPGGGCC